MELSVLTQRLSEAVGDWTSVSVSTNVSTDKHILATDLNKYDMGRDDYFKNTWAYLENGNNAGQDRKIKLYYTSNATCNVFGTDFLADTNTAVIRLHKYSYTSQTKAINDSIREMHGILFNYVDDHTLITGDRLPDSHFEDWISASSATWWAPSTSATLAQTNTKTWGGKYSMLVTAGAANCYACVNSDVFPRLLDLSGNKVTFRSMAQGNQANTAYLELYATNVSGSTQTLRSTTTTVADYWTKIEMEDQELISDMDFLEARVGVLDNAKKAYFDNARLLGRDTLEYLLPKNFQDGEVRQVFLQVYGKSEDYVDDIFPNRWEEVLNWIVEKDGSLRYLRLPSVVTKERKIRIKGTTPLEEMTAFNDDLDLDGDGVNLLIAKAAYKLFLREEGIPSSEDKSTYNSRTRDWEKEYYTLLSKFKMPKPSTKMLLRQG